MWVLRLHECALIFGDVLMALFKISCREFLEGTAAGLMTVGVGGRVAHAADITLGIVYVGPRDDLSGALPTLRAHEPLLIASTL
jgi:hypothetical protein